MKAQEHRTTWVMVAEEMNKTLLSSVLTLNTLVKSTGI